MENRIDILAKWFAGGMTRREALRRFGGLAAGATLASLGVACSNEPTGPRAGAASLDFVPPGRCKKGGQNCRENLECCSQVCDVFTGTCVCPPGQMEGPSSGICFGCSEGAIANPESCTCECPVGTVECLSGKCIQCPDTGSGDFIADIANCECTCPSGACQCPTGTVSCGTAFFPWCCPTETECGPTPFTCMPSPV
jgi:hypothetical protein